jgi:hypothetical protein
VFKFIQSNQIPRLWGSEKQTSSLLRTILNINLTQTTPQPRRPVL